MIGGELSLDDNLSDFTIVQPYSDSNEGPCHSLHMPGSTTSTDVWHARTCSDSL